MNKRIDIIRNIVIDALFLALILLFTYVPQIGYIQVMPTMAITTIHLVVLIGASLFGWKKRYYMVFSLDYLHVLKLVQLQVHNLIFYLLTHLFQFYLELYLD